MTVCWRAETAVTTGVDGGGEDGAAVCAESNAAETQKSASQHRSGRAQYLNLRSTFFIR
jgi:hypothetical protein